MASVKFYLDVPFKKDIDKEKLNEKIRKCKDDNKPYPDSILNDRETSIYLIMNVEGRLLKVKTREKILPKYWQFEKEEKIKPSYTGSLELNDYLDKLKRDVLKHYRTLAEKDKSISFEELKSQIAAIMLGENLSLAKDFIEVFEKFVQVQTKDQGARTIAKYNTTIKTLKDFAIKKKFFLSFENMDLHFYDSFMLFLLNKKNGKYKEEGIGLVNDSISKYFAVIKTFLQWSLERGYHNNITFKNFKASRKAKNEIITLTSEELKKVQDLDLGDNPRLDRLRDLFIFSCFTGQRFSDVQNFKAEDVKDNVWKFISIKTKKITKVPLTGFIKPAKDILDKYDGDIPCRISNQKFNDNIKTIGEMAKINEEVKIIRYSGKKEVEVKKPKWEFMSSHMARRICVTILIERGVPLPVIMLLTQHSDIKTLMRYENTNEDALTRELDRVGNIDKPLMKVAK